MKRMLFKMERGATVLKGLEGITLAAEPGWSGLLVDCPGGVVRGLAYWFYLQPILELQAERKAVLDKALSFLENSLWQPVNESLGASRIS